SRSSSISSRTSPRRSDAAAPPTPARPSLRPLEPCIMTRMRPLHGLLLALAFLVGALIAPASASADKVRLKSGQVLEGTVVREDSGLVWFKTRIGSIEETKVLGKDEIS